MRILELNLKNFGCFEVCTLRPAARFSLLVGDNGSGKTLLLDALAVAAGSFLLGIPEAFCRQINRNEIRAVDVVTGETVTGEQPAEAEVEAVGEVEGTKVRWIRSRRSKEQYTSRRLAKTLQVEASTLVRRARAGIPTTFPVLAYYGAGRQWQRLEGIKLEAPGKVSRFLGYKDWLDPVSDQKRLYRWLKTNEKAVVEYGEKRPLREAVRASIVAMIPDASNAFWDVDCSELTIEAKIGGHPQRQRFHALGDGYRNVVGMAADIGYKMATLNPHLGERANLETPGVVLIDAIDLHLHPNWQRQIVGRLLRAFPRVQFFATSHSPIIIQSVRGLANAMVWDLDSGQPRAIDTESTEELVAEKEGVEIP